MEIVELYFDLAHLLSKFSILLQQKKKKKVCLALSHLNSLKLYLTRVCVEENPGAARQRE